jgi:Flp pilus assembly protein TadG
MTDVVAWLSLSAAGILFILGLVDLTLSWRAASTARDAVANAATLAQDSTASTATLEQQSAIDFKGAWEALASLATAMKDLDRSSRLFVLSLAFLAVAATAAGLGEIAGAVAAP